MRQLQRSLNRLWAAWREIAGYVGDFQARVLLTAFYFTIAVPFGLLARALDPLRVRRTPATTGWVRRRAERTELDAARHQF